MFYLYFIGANFLLRDNNKRLPADIAKFKNHQECYALLHNRQDGKKVETESKLFDVSDDGSSTVNNETNDYEGSNNNKNYNNNNNNGDDKSSEGDKSEKSDS